MNGRRGYVRNLSNCERETCKKTLMTLTDPLEVTHSPSFDYIPHLAGALYFYCKGLVSNLVGA